MPVYRQTLFLGDVAGTYGWTETYFTTDADPAAALIHLDALVGERIKVLVDLCAVFAARTSDEAILRDSQLATSTPAIGLIASTILTAADPWSALNMRMEATPNFRGRKFFHGILEDTFLPNRRYDPANPNNAAWLAWSLYLVNNCYLRRLVLGVPVFTGFTSCFALKETSHKVGRPFDLLHGRRTT